MDDDEIIAKVVHIALFQSQVTTQLLELVFWLNFQSGLQFGNLQLFLVDCEK